VAPSGKIVFIYSIANFPTLRCLEQIRNDICYHNLSVIVTAVGGGCAYGSAGYTHQAVEDLAIMSALPNMAVVAPGDPIETQLALQCLIDRSGPAYLRLGKAGEPVVHRTEPEFRIGKLIEVYPGEDGTIIATGGILHTALQATDMLLKEGVKVQLLSCPSIRPLDEEGILAAARHTGRIITVEEHGPGGLGTLVGEVIARAGISVRFTPIRLPHNPFHHAGSQEFLRSSAGITAQSIAKTMLSMF
jgi:transketolase